MTQHRMTLRWILQRLMTTVVMMVMMVQTDCFGFGLDYPVGEMYGLLHRSLPLLERCLFST